MNCKCWCTLLFAYVKIRPAIFTFSKSFDARVGQQPEFAFFLIIFLVFSYFKFGLSQAQKRECDRYSRIYSTKRPLDDMVCSSCGGRRGRYLSLKDLEVWHR